MSSLPIAPLTFLYLPGYTAEQYFQSGGSLQEVVCAVKGLISSGQFENMGSKETFDIRLRLSAALNYFEKNPPKQKEAPLVGKIWREVYGKVEEADFVDEGREIIRLLREGNVSSYANVVLFGPEKSLYEVVSGIGLVITFMTLSSEKRLKGCAYRQNLRDRLFQRLYYEWTFYHTLRKRADWALDKASISPFWNGIRYLERLDIYDGRLKHYIKGEFDFLSFKDMPYFTDAKFEGYMVDIGNVKYLDLRGCFLLTQEGAERVVNRWGGWIAYLKPDGCQVNSGSPFEAPIPKDFEYAGPVTTKDEDDMVIVDK